MKDAGLTEKERRLLRKLGAPPGTDPLNFVGRLTVGEAGALTPEEMRTLAELMRRPGPGRSSPAEP